MITIKVKDRTVSANVKNKTVYTEVITPTINITEDSKRIPKDLPVYAGTYVVEPKAFSETVLPTNGKVMDDDVTVRRVPYYETSNRDGRTVYIAMEV